MMIKITMSSGNDFTLTQKQAEDLIDATGQLIKISNPDGSWSGRTINKAHIISTTVDHEASREEKLADFGLPVLNVERQEDRMSSISETLDKNREDLKKRGILK